MKAGKGALIIVLKDVGNSNSELSPFFSPARVGMLYVITPNSFFSGLAFFWEEKIKKAEKNMKMSVCLCVYGHNNYSPNHTNLFTYI